MTLPLFHLVERLAVENHEANTDCFLSTESLAVSDVRHSAVFLHVYIEPVLDKVLGHHLSRRNDPVLLWE